MSIIYDCNCDIIDCKKGDVVYVYKKELFKEGFLIDKDMLGVVESLEMCKDEDCFGAQYLRYNAEIKMLNGEKITIKDECQVQLLRKYEFITLKDLKKLLIKVNTQSKQSLDIIGNF